MKKRVPNWETFKYSEIWKIVDDKKGEYKNTGFHCKNDVKLPKDFEKVAIDWSDAESICELNIVGENFEELR